MRSIGVIVLASLAVLAACQATGPAGDRASYRYTWKSYVEGQDIRAACSDEAPESRLRLVYNAIFTETVRTYDFVHAADGGARLETRLWRGTELVRVVNGNLLTSIEPVSGEAAVSPGEMETLVARLQQDGMFAGPPTGAVLRSDDFFWLGLACLEGRFWVQAWPHRPLDELAFVAPLVALDPIAKPLPRVRPLDLPPINAVGTGPLDESTETGRLFYRIDFTAAGPAANWRQ